MPDIVSLETVAEGEAVNVCVTIKSFTSSAGMVNVKEKVMGVLLRFSPAVTVLVTVPGAVIAAPSFTLVSPTVCVPAAIGAGVPDSNMVILISVLTACGLEGLISPDAVTPFCVTLSVVKPIV